MLIRYDVEFRLRPISPVFEFQPSPNESVHNFEGGSRRLPGNARSRADGPKHAHAKHDRDHEGQEYGATNLRRR